jgi:hypothetical protein
LDELLAFTQRCRLPTIACLQSGHTASAGLMERLLVTNTLFCTNKPQWIAAGPESLSTPVRQCTAPRLTPGARRWLFAYFRETFSNQMGMDISTRLIFVVNLGVKKTAAVGCVE